MRVASFFSGIGGFDLGFERAGMEVVFQSEIKESSRKILKKHWADVKLMGDINKINSTDIPDAELYCGGFPCQDVSLANQGKRKGLKGERSGLFYRFAELAGERNPQWIVLENVAGLLNSNNGKDFGAILTTLDELGYGVSWRVFDAKFFGTPQRRRRVFIVGSLGGLGSSRVLFDNPTDRFASDQSSRQKQVSASRVGGRVYGAETYLIQHASIGRHHAAGPQAKGYRNDGEAYTLDSRGSGDAVCSTIDGFRVREATGVSDRMDGYRYAAVGNAVAVPVVEWIGKQIVREEILMRRR